MVASHIEVVILVVREGVELNDAAVLRNVNQLVLGQQGAIVKVAAVFDCHQSIVEVLQPEVEAAALRGIFEDEKTLAIGEDEIDDIC